MTDQVNRLTPGRSYELLLLDFGGVCLLNPVEMHDIAETAMGLAAGTLDWMGPLDPSTDPLWVEMISGASLTERQYWAERAAQVGRHGGIEMTLPQYMELLYEPPRAELIRPGCSRVTKAARDFGIQVAVLTNDMRAFHGREWEHGVPFLTEIDHIADCSDTDILKPDPRAYERALSMTGHRADQVLFVDDQPGNVTGAVTYGMDAVWFDIANAEPAWNRVGELLGLG